MGFSYSFAGAGAAAPPEVFAPRTATVSEKVSEKIARRPTSAARYFDAAASARPASSRSRSRASTPDHHDRYRDGLSVAGRAVGTPSFAADRPFDPRRRAVRLGTRGNAARSPGIDHDGGGGEQRASREGNAEEGGGAPGVRVSRRGGKVQGGTHQDGRRGGGWRGGVCVRRGDGGERGGGERGGGGAGEERVDASRVGASSPSSRPASARPAWR